MESDYTELELVLQPIDRVLLDTDGIVEASDNKGQEFGMSRLKPALQEPNASAQSVLKTVQEFALGGTLADDATAIVLRH
jgi:serine phosphatase RsbU (regulator of sigma subunit)